MHDPARVLREVEAKRRVVARHRPPCPQSCP
ncbi:DUF6221 family protein [Streptomyces virginiae]|uniref:DUF6221 family protein n=1 Tax=Streptomyces virginiae TaxID=1961 RepID=A0ABZ1TTZ1_STRVG|nr:DUF6221 family protein [Streptomyces virginiae]